MKGDFMASSASAMNIDSIPASDSADPLSIGEDLKVRGDAGIDVDAHILAKTAEMDRDLKFLTPQGFWGYHLQNEAAIKAAKDALGRVTEALVNKTLTFNIKKRLYIFVQRLEEGYFNTSGHILAETTLLLEKALQHCKPDDYEYLILFQIYLIRFDIRKNPRQFDGAKIPVLLQLLGKLDADLNNSTHKIISKELVELSDKLRGMKLFDFSRAILIEARRLPNVLPVLANIEFGLINIDLETKRAVERKQFLELSKRLDDMNVELNFPDVREDAENSLYYTDEGPTYWELSYKMETMLKHHQILRNYCSESEILHFFEVTLQFYPELYNYKMINVLFDFTHQLKRGTLSSSIAKVLEILEARFCPKDYFVNHDDSEDDWHENENLCHYIAKLQAFANGLFDPRLFGEAARFYELIFRVEQAYFNYEGQYEVNFKHDGAQLRLRTALIYLNQTPPQLEKAKQLLGNSLDQWAKEVRPLTEQTVAIRDQLRIRINAIQANAVAASAGAASAGSASASAAGVPMDVDSSAKVVSEDLSAKISHDTNSSNKRKSSSLTSHFEQLRGSFNSNSRNSDNSSYSGNGDGTTPPTQRTQATGGASSSASAGTLGAAAAAAVTSAGLGSASAAADSNATSEKDGDEQTPKAKKAKVDN